MSTFIAKYAGTCDACDEHIAAGDEVTYSASSKVIHVECPDTLKTTDHGYCDSCFLALPATKKCTNCD